MLLIDFFDKGVERAPDRACLVDGASQRTYREVQNASNRIARTLAATVPAGTKVAIYSGNSIAAFECLIGIIRSGCVWVTVNARNAIAETAFVLNLTDVEMLFFSGAFAENVAALRRECPKLQHLIAIDQAVAGFPVLDDWLAGHGEEPFEVMARPDDVVSLVVTGGATGNPRAAVQSHRTWEAMVANAGVLGAPDPVHLVVAPMTHAAGAVALTMMPMTATHVILPGFDAAKVLDAIERHRITHLYLPPTALYMLLSQPGVKERDYSSLRFLMCGAAPLAVDKLREAIDVFGPVLCQSYGQTEAGIRIGFNAPTDHVEAIKTGNVRRLGSCGRANTFARVEIIGEDGALQPLETRGEIVIRCNSTMVEYYKDREETERVSRFGWHHTGDIGLKDKDGWIYIVDRKKDMIISGGFNIYPAEIERILLKHDAVQDCAVIGKPDGKWGEAVTAVVELKSGRHVAPEELDELCRSHIAGYKVPKTYEFWPQLPRSAVGKVLKREIRDHFWQGHTRKI
jgi:acyl-CoA synthetase (AMP-forming)/AMP-acid ligase II